MNKKRIVVLVSGSGSNLQAIIDACNNNTIHGEVVGVVSNRAGVYALQRAEKHSIPFSVIEHNKFVTRTEFDQALALQVRAYDPDVVVLAGFMRILSADFVNQFAGKMFNIHPSLLPKYPGLNTHQKALDNQDEFHGCSIHFVTAELDGGPIVLQSRIPILPDDTNETLPKRIAKQEWIIYPLMLSWYCEGRLTLVDGHVCFDNDKIKKQGILYEELLRP